MSTLKSDKFYDYEFGKNFQLSKLSYLFPGNPHMATSRYCRNIFFHANYPVAKPLGPKVTFKYEENKSRLLE